MMKHLLAIAAILLMSAATLPLRAAPPRADARATATITFADGSTATLLASTRDRFRVVDVLPGETVTVSAQLPPGAANAPAFAQALDGGTVSPTLSFLPDGTASLTFRAGGEPAFTASLLVSAIGWRCCNSASRRHRINQFLLGTKLSNL